MELQRRKVVIIGAGHVGSHAGYALLSQGLVEEIVYIDIDRKKAEAQALDLSDATAYLPSHAVVRAGDYTDAEDAQLLIVAAGPLPDMSKGQTRMDTLRQTIEVMKDVTEGIRMSGFAGIILSISNPADVIAHYLQHQLNWLPRQVLSTSTTLDSARLRRAISEAVGIDRKSVIAYALGNMERARCSTEFGIGASIAEVVRAIFHDENRILPVSVLLEGEYGQRDVYASVPAVLNRNGVAGIIELALTPEEQERFNTSCETMRDNFRLSLTL